MSGDRDVSEVILAGWVSLLRQARVPNPQAIARQQLGIAKAHGVRFVVPAHWHDPNANALDRPEPGDQQAGLISVLAAIGKGICPCCGERVDLAEDGRLLLHQISDDPPHPPFYPCPGSLKPPRNAPTDPKEQQ
ncbi:MAG: hypothetical protein ACRDNS_19140 [Trebonia sp.]